MDVLWIASYPRSGNTWLRHLLHDLLFGPAESSRALNSRIPCLHRTPNLARRDGLMLVKTHFQLWPGHRYLSRTAGCIYLIRDPRDVLLSAVKYARLNDEEVDPPGFIREYIRVGGVQNWLEQGFGTWAQHADTWLGVGGLPRILVRYEDLRRDAIGEVTRLSEFLKLGKPPSAIRAAVERNSLERLRAMEDEEKRADACWFPGTAEQLGEGVRFFNEGRTGQRLDEIEPGLDALFDERFGEEMRRHGYEPVTSGEERGRAREVG